MWRIVVRPFAFDNDQTMVTQRLHAENMQTGRNRKRSEKIAELDRIRRNSTDIDEFTHQGGKRIPEQPGKHLVNDVQSWQSATNDFFLAGEIVRDYTRNFFRHFIRFRFF